MTSARALLNRVKSGRSAARRHAAVKMSANDARVAVAPSRARATSRAISMEDEEATPPLTTLLLSHREVQAVRRKEVQKEVQR